jgi:hypothetical protein
VSKTLSLIRRGQGEVVTDTDIKKEKYSKSGVFISNKLLRVVRNK